VPAAAAQATCIKVCTENNSILINALDKMNQFADSGTRDNLQDIIDITCKRDCRDAIRD
jgi:hypothetical protein